MAAHPRSPRCGCLACADWRAANGLPQPLPLFAQVGYAERVRLSDPKIRAALWHRRRTVPVAQR